MGKPAQVLSRQVGDVSLQTLFLRSPLGVHAQVGGALLRHRILHGRGCHHLEVRILVHAGVARTTVYLDVPAQNFNVAGQNIALAVQLHERFYIVAGVSAPRRAAGSVIVVGAGRRRRDRRSSRRRKLRIGAGVRGSRSGVRRRGRHRVCRRGRGTVAPRAAARAAPERRQVRILLLGRSRRRNRRRRRAAGRSGFGRRRAGNAVGRSNWHDEARL